MCAGRPAASTSVPEGDSELSLLPPPAAGIPGTPHHARLWGARSASYQPPTPFHTVLRKRLLEVSNRNMFLIFTNLFGSFAVLRMEPRVSELLNKGINIVLIQSSLLCELNYVSGRP